MTDRAQRLGPLVHARVGADPEHREADASRAVGLVLWRAHARETRVAEIRRGRSAEALLRQSLLAWCGLGGVGGGHCSWLGQGTVAVLVQVDPAKKTAGRTHKNIPLGSRGDEVAVLDTLHGVYLS